MYRILEEAGEVRERRDPLRHPNYSKPELLATGPNEVWSWDITKLLGPVKWSYFYLYVIVDIFRRYVVGWMVARRESAELAERLIEESCRKQGIRPGQLTLHADRGSSMTSKPVACLLSDLGITKTHSRPAACRGGDGLTMGGVNFQCPQRVKIGCSLTPAASARPSTLGTTGSIGTAVSVCSRPKSCTTAMPTP
jgi:transposase InsO family protein